MIVQFQKYPNTCSSPMEGQWKFQGGVGVAKAKLEFPVGSGGARDIFRNHTLSVCLYSFHGWNLSGMHMPSQPMYKMFNRYSSEGVKSASDLQLRMA